MSMCRLIVGRHLLDKKQLVGRPTFMSVVLMLVLLLLCVLVMVRFSTRANRLKFISDRPLRRLVFTSELVL